MKNLILILSMLFSLSGCSDDDKSPQDESIIGTWKLIETYGSDGGSNPQWHIVEDGYTYTFKSDGTFTSTRFSECGHGTFVLSESSLTLIFECEGFTTGIESPEGTFIEDYVLISANLVLTPTYQNCIEGCDYKFQKILSE